MIIPLLCSVLTSVAGHVQVTFYTPVKNKLLSFSLIVLCAASMYGYTAYRDGLSPFVFLAAGILVCVFAYFCFVGHVFCKIHNVLIQAYVTALSYAVSEQLAPVLFPGNETDSTSILCLLLVLFWCLFMGVARKHLFNTMPFSEKTYLKSSVIFSVGYPVLLLLSTGCFQSLSDTVKGGSLLFFALLGTMVVVWSLTFIATSKEGLIARNQLQAYSIQQQLLRQNIDNMVEYHESMRVIRHDYKHCNATLLNMLESKEYERAYAFLKEQSDVSVSGAVFDSFCEHPIINAVISNSHHHANQQNIDFECELRISDPLTIGDVELSTLLLNSFSNAVEHSDTDPTSGKKWIKAAVYTANDHFVIKILNSVDRKIAITNNHIETTKPDDGEYHGIGLESIGRVVKSCNGTLEINQVGNTFTLLAVLPNAETCKAPPRKGLA